MCKSSIIYKCAISHSHVEFPYGYHFGFSTATKDFVRSPSGIVRRPAQVFHKRGKGPIHHLGLTQTGLEV